MGSYIYHIVVKVIIISTLSLVANSKTHKNDIEILKDLKHSINPNSISPGSCISSWDFSFDPCDSLSSDHFTCGFRCDLLLSGLNRVTDIILDQLGYSGSLSHSSSWNLPYLQTLDLSFNSFTGPLPTSLSNLTRLHRLSLSGNSFFGHLPASLSSLTLLHQLYLDNNNFSGPIPRSFNSLVNLQKLQIQVNNFSGLIPNLGQLKTLYYIDASHNKLSGEIPNTFPSSIVELSFRNNLLTGTIPHNINQLHYLQVLDVSNNLLSGVIFSVLFDHPSLQQLTLSHNNFTFLQVPGDSGVHSNLIAIDLSHNKLHGLLPAFMASMNKLTALSLEHNMFTGMIPFWYAAKAAVPPGIRTEPFRRLLLGGNYLLGLIPGLFMGLEPGSINVSLVDNCLYSCPSIFFFCRGGDQKSLLACKRLWPIIP